MTQTIPPLPQGSASEQAEYWLALLESPWFDERQGLLFRQWLAANQDNLLAWEKLQNWWQNMDALSPAQRSILEQRLTTKARVNSPSPRSRPISWAIPVFACLLLAVWLGFAAGAGYFADFHTSTGEQRRIQLSDGSMVLLNTDSALSVNFSDRRRTITLHGGEAYFEVAPDAGRPFEVHTGSGRVRALGTAFDVKQLQAEMEVTVYEHSVRVSIAEGETMERLQQGQRVVAGAGQIGPIENVNLKQAKAWRDGRLVFKDKPLRQVVAELNRYRPGKIVIADPSLAEHLVTGVFDAAAPEAALSAIEKTLSVAETRLTERLVFLRRM
ncbi:MAG: FecR family protein [Methylococcaceae bacterium]|nr:FecR family protein [Methylococcaceae bacterium]